MLLTHINQQYTIVLVDNVLEYGKYGLYGFFVLSGYLAAKWNGEKRKGWVKGKIIRILPSYYVMIMIYYLIHNLIIADTPVDVGNLGWFRYLFGLNAILPSSILFWKSIHALWYVSVVWCFYLVHAMLWNALKDKNFFGFIILWIILSSNAILIDFRDKELFFVNGIGFFQYFVLGIAAEKFRRNSNIMWLGSILAGLPVLFAFVMKDTWIAGNLLSALFFYFVICIGKERIYENNESRTLRSVLEQNSYNIYLVHPLLIDYLVPFLRRLGIGSFLQIALFFFVLAIAVYAIKKIEKRVQITVSRVFK